MPLAAPRARMWALAHRVGCRHDTIRSLLCSLPPPVPSAAPALHSLTASLSLRTFPSAAVPSPSLPSPSPPLPLRCHCLFAAAAGEKEFFFDPHTGEAFTEMPLTEEDKERIAREERQLKEARGGGSAGSAGSGVSGS